MSVTLYDSSSIKPPAGRFKLKVERKLYRFAELAKKGLKVDAHSPITVKLETGVSKVISMLAGILQVLFPVK